MNSEDIDAIADYINTLAGYLDDLHITLIGLSSYLYHLSEDMKLLEKED